VDALSTSQAKKMPFLWRGDEQSLRKLICIKSGDESRDNYSIQRQFNLATNIDATVA
jgi:hypothetical protein